MIRGSWVVDPTHWDGLLDGHTCSTLVEGPRRAGDPLPPCAANDANNSCGEPNPLQALLTRSHLAATPVAKRPLTAYDSAAGVAPNPRPAAAPTSQSAHAISGEFR